MQRYQYRRRHFETGICLQAIIMIASAVIPILRFGWRLGGMLQSPVTTRRRGGIGGRAFLAISATRSEAPHITLQLKDQQDRKQSWCLHQFSSARLNRALTFLVTRHF